MEEQSLMFAIFGVVEYITKSELTNIAKTLIYNYYQSSEQPTSPGRARESVFRYTQCKSLPIISDIQKKTRWQLNKLEHLVLRMEYEARRVEGTLSGPLVASAESSADTDEAPEAQPYSPPVPRPAQEGPGPFRAEESAPPKPKALPLPSVITPRKNPLTQGSFTGVRVKRSTAPKAKPGKPKSNARPGKKPARGQTARQRPAASKTVRRKKPGR
jgi:hypothetical protein